MNAQPFDAETDCEGIYLEVKEEGVLEGFVYDDAALSSRLDQDVRVRVGSAAESRPSLIADGRANVLLAIEPF